MTTTEESEDREALEAGRVLFAQACTFVRGAVGPESLPPADLPEVAFAGRSNVGKSSLLNALTGRRALARVSHTPGRTREINFFDLGGRLILVDLPGYGYARAPKSAIAGWTRFTRDYLRGRPTLRRLCLLIDSRHGVKKADRELMDLLDETAVAYQVVLTKADKPDRAALDRCMAAVAAEIKARAAAHPGIVATSARTGTGIPELRAALATLAAPRRFR